MKLDKNNLPPLKIRVSNADESERAQRAFFALGYTWYEYDYDQPTGILRGCLIIAADLQKQLNNANRSNFKRLWGEEISLTDLEALAFGEAPTPNGIVVNHCFIDDAIEDAADKWVFETNAHKWSNNDNTAGDNYGSFVAGAKWANEHFGQNTCLAMNEAIEAKPQSTESEATPCEKFFDYWLQEHGITTLDSDYNEMLWLFGRSESQIESEAQRRYGAALSVIPDYHPAKEMMKDNDNSTLAYALRIAAGLETTEK